MNGISQRLCAATITNGIGVLLFAVALLAIAGSAQASECVYLADISTGALFIVNTDTWSIDKIPVGMHLQDVAVVGRYAYAVDAGPQVTFPYSRGSLVVIDLESKNAARTVPLGVAPSDIAIGNNTAYIPSDVVDVVPLGTYETSTIGGFATPNRVALKTDGSALYVGSQVGRVDLVDTASLTVTRQVAVPGGVTALAADNDLVLVGSDGITLAYDTALQPRFTVPDTGLSNNLAIAGDVAYSATLAVFGGQLLRIHLTPPYDVDAIYVNPRILIEYDLFDVKVSADKRRAYVGAGQALYIVDTTTLTVQEVDIAGGFQGLDVAPCAGASTPTATASPRSIPTSTGTATVTPSPTHSATATPTATITMTATPTATPAVSATATQTQTASPSNGDMSQGGCSMNRHHNSRGFFGLLVVPLIFLAARRRALLGVCLAVASAASVQAQSLPNVFPGRVIVKFTDSLTQCAHCLLSAGQSFQSALTDGSPSVDQINQAVGVSGARALFFERHGMTTDAANVAYQAQLAAVRSRFPQRTARIPPEAPPSPVLTNVYAFQFAQPMHPLDVCAKYRADPHVAWCQPDYVATASEIPNDPYFFSSGSWGQSYPDLWGVKALQSSLAWNTTQGEGMVVAVVDTGVDAQHPDMAANVWINPGEIPNNGYDDDNNGKTDDVAGWDFVDNDNLPQDEYGHGTHVAGTIAAVGNNNLGIIGIAPMAKILPVRALDQNGSGSFQDLADAIKYAADTGADIINNSWGCQSRCPSNPVAEDAVRYAVGQGAVVVFAAGNSKDDVFYYSPQNMTDPYTKPLVVAANDNRGHEADFGNGAGTDFGAAVDVSAPGGGLPTDPLVKFFPTENILSLKSSVCPICAAHPQLIVGTDYLRLAGTSMAAPHAAGVAALVMACNPGLFNIDVRHVVESTAARLLPDGRIGFRQVNSFKALAVTAAPKVVLTAPSRLSVFHPGNGPASIRGTLDGNTLSQWNVDIGNGTAPTKWRRLAKGRQAVADDVLATFDPASLPFGVQTIRLLARYRLPMQTPSMSQYVCGNPRVTRTNRSRYLEEVQHILVEPDITQVTPADGTSYTNPSISGTRVAAEQYDGNGLLIGVYVVDLQTGQVWHVPGGTLPYLDPDNSSHLVYVRSVGSTTAVSLFDLSTQQDRQITAGTAEPVPYEPPAISGNRIVWGDTRNGPQQVFSYDLSTDTESQVASSGHLPHINGNRVVWKVGNAQGTQAGIQLYDFTTRQQQVIVSEKTPGDCVHINGDWVVSDSYDSFVCFPTPFGCAYIPSGVVYAHNLATGETRTLTSEGFNQCPAVEGTVVAWPQFLQASGWVLFGEDLATTQPSQQLTFHPNSDVTAVATANRRIVWQDLRDNPTSDIYLHNF